MLLSTRDTSKAVTKAEADDEIFAHTYMHTHTLLNTTATNSGANSL